MDLEGYLHELRDSERALSASRLISLSNLNDEEVSLLRYWWPQIDAERRRRILARLSDLTEDSVELSFDEVFMVALTDEDAEARQMAIAGLWEHEGRDLIPQLTHILRQDTEAKVRAEAANALGRFALRAEYEELRAADAERVDEALRATIDDPHEAEDVRARAIEAVAPRTTAWVHQMIAGAYESPQRRLRIGAVHAMGRNCDSKWLPALHHELQSDDAEMRFEAAVACGTIADESSVPYLAPLLKDGDREVQEAAIAALGEIGGEAAKRALRQAMADPDDRVREAAVAAMAELEFGEDGIGLGPVT